MAIWIDVIVVAVIWLCVVYGAKKGAVKTIFETLAFVIAAVVTSLIYKPVTGYLLQMPFVEKWTAGLNENLFSGVNQAAGDAVSTLPSWISGPLEGVAGAANAAVSDGLTALLVGILSVLLIYLVVRLVLSLLVGILDGIMHLPVLNSINKGAGLILGGIKGVFLIWLVFAVLLLFASMPFFLEMNSTIQSTYVARYFYNNNWLMEWIMRL